MGISRYITGFIHIFHLIMALNPFKDIEFRLIDIFIQHVKELEINEIYLFGITKFKQSICCVIRDFEIHFIIKLPYKTEMSENIFRNINGKENVKKVSKQAIGYYSCIKKFR